MPDTSPQEHPDSPEAQLRALRGAYARREALYRLLGRLQEEIWRMQRADDIQKVLNVLQAGLSDLEISYLYCSVNVVDTSREPPAVAAFNIAQTGLPKLMPIGVEAAATIVDFWRSGGPVYRADLEADDPYGEAVYLNGVRSVIDVPFSHGTLALSNRDPDGFCDDDIAILQELANAISTVYSRYLDFRMMEAQNLRLTAERAAERVRSAVLVMQGAEDLGGILKVMLAELTTAGIDYDLCLLRIFDEKNGVLRQLAALPGGEWRQAEMALGDVTEATIAVYHRQEVVSRPVDEALAAELADTARQLDLGPGAARRPAAVIEAPFAQGTLCLTAQRIDGLNEVARLCLSELARVLELGYVRHLDLERVEAQKGLTRALSRQGQGGEFIGTSEALGDLEAQIEHVAPTDLTVLITGETGTGKGVAARTIHQRSRRQGGPFVQVNCGAIAEGLVESELFGHEKGAFTGATSRQLGKVELAESGTLFLDEIGDMPLGAQVKLLQVLQERTFERVGGTQTLKSGARVVAATNRDLEQMVREDRFREDLYFRLQVFPVRVPALRERRQDIPLLAAFFAETFAQHLHRPVPAFSPEAIDRLQRAPWPGNVRELEHLVQRAVLMSDGGRIEERHLVLAPGPEAGTAPAVAAPESEDVVPLAEHEKRYIARVLELTDGVVSGPRGAARLLDMHPETLRARMRKHGLR